jgi:hypothetical protein
MTLKKALSTILLAGLISGTLDALAALVFYGPVLGSLSADRLFRGIAGGAFGKAAFEEGRPMALFGILFHYFNAFSFSILYYVVYPRFSFLHKHKILSGIFYGIFIWIVMNQVVILFPGFLWGFIFGRP